jgi:CRP-like cAMP-binding protein
VKLLNFFLTALSADDLAALAPHLIEVGLSGGQVLFRPDQIVDTLYFPGSACVSIVTTMRDGKAVETATVGRESAVGLLDAATSSRSRSRVFVQVGGGAMRIAASKFRERLLESPSLARLTLMHARATAAQAEQGVACNIIHDVRGRLARWLLMTQDRVGADTFPLTQEYMAVMTGVQRSTVSVMAGHLKKAKVIDYSRGILTILDRPALIEHACECYAVVQEEFEDLRNGRSPPGT